MLSYKIIRENASIIQKEVRKVTTRSEVVMKQKYIWWNRRENVNSFWNLNTQSANHE